MNKEDALRQLLNYLAMIDAHDDFTPELLALIAGSGTEADVFRLLVMRLTMLKALGIYAVAFHERAGKRKTDYSGYIPQAAERLRQKKEEL